MCWLPTLPWQPQATSPSSTRTSAESHALLRAIYMVGDDSDLLSLFLSIINRKNKRHKWNQSLWGEMTPAHPNKGKRTFTTHVCQGSVFVLEKSIMLWEEAVWWGNLEATPEKGKPNKKGEKCHALSMKINHFLNKLSLIYLIWEWNHNKNEYLHTKNFIFLLIFTHKTYLYSSSVL